MSSLRLRWRAPWLAGVVALVLALGVDSAVASVHVPAAPLPGKVDGPVVLVYEDHVPTAVGPQEVIADVTAHAVGKAASNMFSVIIVCGKQTYLQTTNTVGHAKSRLRPKFYMDDATHCRVYVQSGHGHTKADYLVVDSVKVTRKTFASWAIGFDKVGTGRLLKPGHTLDTTAASMRTAAARIAVVGDTKVTACSAQMGSRERNGPNLCPDIYRPKAVAHIKFTLYVEQFNASGKGYCAITRLGTSTVAIDHKLHHAVAYLSAFYTLSHRRDAALECAPRWAFATSATSSRCSMPAAPSSCCTVRSRAEHRSRCSAEVECLRDLGEGLEVGVNRS